MAIARIGETGYEVVSMVLALGLLTYPPRSHAQKSRYQRLIQCVMREDHGIANLLDLHDQIIDQDGGYWVKIEAWRVEG